MLFLLMVFLGYNSAFADIVIPKSPWAWGFLESGVGEFDHLQAKLEQADPLFEPVEFQSPCFFSSSEGWAQTANNGLVMLADGPPTSSLGGVLYFTDSAPFTLHLQFWSMVNAENTDLFWDGGGWTGGSVPLSTETVDFQERLGAPNSGAVPEPLSFLVWLGLGGLWGLRRRWSS